MKFFLDKLISLILIIFFSPVFIIIPLIIFLYDFSNPFYTPYRIGMNNKKFKMIKFRSMVLNADKNSIDSTKKDDQRITPIGKFIRKFKLDEISQLLNVLIGNMSLVGPRPNVEREVQMYSKEEMKILTVKPGITDFASIVFADEGDILFGSEDPDLKYNQIIRPWKSRLAILYVEKNNFLIDIYILFLTFFSFFKRKYTLSLLSKFINKVSDDKMLVDMCRREFSLKSMPPPGFNEIIKKRF